jgi:2C-methyl-D-erythritol 2,4-cyclodiphosphate synthase
MEIPYKRDWAAGAMGIVLIIAVMDALLGCRRPWVISGHNSRRGDPQFKDISSLVLLARVK